MDRKRGWVEEADDGGCSVSEAKRRRVLLDSMREVTVMRSIEQQLPQIEPLVRRVVREAVQDALWRCLHLEPRVPLNRVHAAMSKPYKLQFQNSLPKTIFTNKKIEAEGQKPVQIVIVNSDSEIVTSGHFSSVKVEIVVLDGEFCADGRDEWTEREFLDKIVREREGKRPLLTGDLVVTLTNGVGCLGDINFTDNSSWIRSRKFRLGARVYGQNSVHEAISGAFLVKDHRGESYQKHHPPLLTDDIWRLEKIGKDGVFHKKLEENGINTVRDFLKNMVMDQDRLRNLLGNGMPNKMWDATVEHAWECCIPKDVLYEYQGYPGLTLIFDSIYQLVGAILDDKFYPVDEIPLPQKVLVNKLKEDAYKTPDLIVELNQQLAYDFRSLPSSATDTFTVPWEGLSSQQIVGLLSAGEGDPNLSVDLPQQLHHPSRNYLMENPNPLKHIFTAQPLDQVQRFDSFQRNSFNSRGCCDMLLGNAETTGLVEPVTINDPMTRLNEADMLCSSPLPVLWDYRVEFLQVADAEISRSHAPHSFYNCARNSSGKWAKLMAVSKWMGVARRSARKASLLDTHYPMMLPSTYDIYAGGGLWT